MNNIYLCGFMGCGKTSVGLVLADLLKYKFIDTDEYIVNMLNMSIPMIFKTKGEQYFRETETAALKEISELGETLVVSCGGGVMLKSDNADIAKANSTVVYIDVDFETCYSRICNDQNRPIVANNTKEQLRDIYNSRIALYNKNSDIAVSGEGTPEEVAKRIVGAACGRPK